MALNITTERVQLSVYANTAYYILLVTTTFLQHYRYDE